MPVQKAGDYSSIKPFVSMDSLAINIIGMEVKHRHFREMKEQEQVDPSNSLRYLDLLLICTVLFMILDVTGDLFDVTSYTCNVSYHVFSCRINGAILYWLSVVLALR